MRSTLTLILGCLAVLFLSLACVDPEDLTLRGTVDIIVVDGTVTNLAEPQIIRLNRSQADRLTGRFGSLPITKAQVEVVMDSSVVILAHETTDGNYQLPADFKGHIGYAYQLRLTLSDGAHYESTQQVMPPVACIDQIHAQFNFKSLSPPLGATLPRVMMCLLSCKTPPTSATTTAGIGSTTSPSTGAVAANRAFTQSISPSK